MVQRLRDRDRADGGYARQRNRYSSDVGDGIVEQLTYVQPRQSFDLRNDLVRSGVHAEVIDIVAAEQRSKRGAHLSHGQPELRRLITVDLNHRLRQIEPEI